MKHLALAFSQLFFLFAVLFAASSNGVAQTSTAQPAETKKTVPPAPKWSLDPTLQPTLKPLINPQVLPKLDPKNLDRIRDSMKRGGDWQSSGGTGIACFDSSKNATLFDETSRANQMLSDDLISHIQTLKTLEVWESEELKSNFTPTSGASADKILNVAELRLAKSASLFYFQLEAVKSQIHLASWIGETALAPTHDAKLARTMSPTESEVCRQIQLAVRVNKKTTVDVMPEIHVFFDPRLYSKLDALNQAALNLHERIYVLGRQVGHADSAYTRSLTSMLLNEAFWKKIEDQDIGMQAMLVQNLINQSFGDYVHVLFQTLAEHTNAAPGTSASRLLSLRSAVRKIRSVTDICNNDPNSPQGDQKQLYCLSKGVEAGSDGALYDAFTDEESFVFLSRWVLTPVLPHTPNVELQLVDWVDPEMKRLSKWTLESHCGLLLYLQNDGRPTRFKLEKPARYCSSLGMKPISL